MPYSVLLDTGTNCALAVSTNISAVVFANENIPDTWHIRSVNYPNYLKAKLFRKNAFFLATAPPETYPEWSWNRKTRMFAPTHDEVLTEDLRAKSKLAVAEVRTIADIMRELSGARYQLRTGVEFQEIAYLLKRTQAQQCKDAGYQESDAAHFPFVTQYADFAEISLKEAADEILFKAKLDDEVLLKTEGLRLKYFDKVKRARTPEEMPGIFQEFLRDFYLNAMI